MLKNAICESYKSESGSFIKKRFKIFGNFDYKTFSIEWINIVIPNPKN